MIVIETFEGVKAKVQMLRTRILPVALFAALAVMISACGGGATSSNSTMTGTVDPNETAATVNGKVIKMEDVERAVKQQAQGQEGQLSQLELAGARLQVLQSLIEQEVMFQKAEKEGTLPTDEEVTAEYNKRRTATGLSQEQFDAKMKEVGETDASARLAIKKGLAIQKLNDRITGKIEPAKDNEIAQFFNSNPEAFKNKRGAQLGAIVIDPSDAGQGDTTRNEIEAQTKAKEIGTRIMQGADFATVARESSEDSDTRFKGGDWRYFSEEQMKQVFPQGFAEQVMTKMQAGQIFPQLIPFEGRFLIVKLQRKQETDEARTLETPGVRQEITEYLLNARKQLLAASYQAIAMNEAKIDNFLAKKVVENPNELSGARPAAPAGNTNTAAPAANANVAPANAGNAASGNAAANSASNAARPAANSNTNSNARR
jgi:parvulin-like peptidyl-prolyl isomerase